MFEFEGFFSDEARGIVGWDSANDPSNPRNFSAGSKWFYLGLLSAVTALSALASSMPAPGVDFINRDFHLNNSILDAFSVSVFVLGFAVGPLLLSPLSEIYGRQTVLNPSNAFLTVWQLGCALAPNMATLIISRFFAGVGGSASLTIGGGVVSDLFPLTQRGRASALFSLGPLLGPVVGPIVGGFVAQRIGWRWVYWILFIACAVISISNAFLNKETNAAVILRHKTKLQRERKQRTDLFTAYDVSRNKNESRTTRILLQSIIRPFRIVFSSPVLAFLLIYISFLFGLLYLLFTTITSVFTETYRWPVDLAGLSYLGIGLGFVVGILIVAKTSDATTLRLTNANNGIYQPEMRLASCLIFALLVPISFFWYGWSVERHTHWIVPIIGLMPFGIGLMGIFASIQTYFIDVSGEYAASAVAGMTSVRCLFGAALPLAGSSMYSSLGVGWGNSLLGFIALGLIPAPALIFRYGAEFRTKHPVDLH